MYLLKCHIVGKSNVAAYLLSAKCHFFIRSLLFHNNNVTKAPPTGITGRSNATVENASVQLLEEANADGPVTHAWSVTPDVIEGDHGEVAAPGQSDTDTTEICQDRVAAVFSTLKALVRVAPHTVSGSNCFRFSENIFESYLKQNPLLSKIYLKPKVTLHFLVTTISILILIYRQISY